MSCPTKVWASASLCRWNDVGFVTFAKYYYHNCQELITKLPLRGRKFLLVLKWRWSRRNWRPRPLTDSSHSHRTFRHTVPLAHIGLHSIYRLRTTSCWKRKCNFKSIRWALVCFHGAHFLKCTIPIAVRHM